MTFFERGSCRKSSDLPHLGEAAAVHGRLPSLEKVRPRTLARARGRTSLGKAIAARVRLPLLALEEHVVGVQPALDRASVEAIFGIDHERVHLLLAQHLVERIGQLDFAAHARLHVG